MPLRMIRILLLSLVAAAGPSMAAEGAPRAASGDPRTAMQVPYASSFADYRPFKEPATKPWPESNALVERLGGWKAYASDGAGDARVSQPASGEPKAGPAHTGHGAQR